MVILENLFWTLPTPNFLEKGFIAIAELICKET